MASRLPALSEISVPAIDDLLYMVDVSDTTDHATGSSRKVSGSRFAGLLLRNLCEGRLTLESGVPVSITDQADKSTLYFALYNGNRIGLYDGTRWILYTFTERSLALSGLTANKNYDVFMYDNAGTLTLELSAAWTNDTTRADALTTQDGIYVKDGATTRRFLGTIRTTDTDKTQDTLAKRFVWNTHNQVPRSLYREESGTWTYTSATPRQANANAANQVEIVVGMAGCVAHVGLNAGAGSAQNVAASTGIGINTTSAYSNTVATTIWVNSASDGREMYHHILTDHARVGYTFYSWNENSNGVSDETFRGGNLCGAING